MRERRGSRGVTEGRGCSASLSSSDFLIRVSWGFHGVRDKLTAVIYQDEKAEEAMMSHDVTSAGRAEIFFPDSQFS